MCNLKKSFVNWMATVMPDSCPFNREVKIGDIYLFTFPAICQINPLYEDVVKEKLRRLGYED